MFDEPKRPARTIYDLLGITSPSVATPQPSLYLPPQFSQTSVPPPSPPTKDLKSPLTKKWNPGFHTTVRARLKWVTAVNPKRIRNITKGLTMPEISSVPIGSAKKMEAAILFFDLENFTDITSKLPNEVVLYFSI